MEGSAAAVTLSQAQLQDLLTQAAQKGAQAATAAAAAASAPPPPPKPTVATASDKLAAVTAAHASGGTGIHITLQGVFNILGDILSILGEVFPGNKVVSEVGAVAGVVEPVATDVLKSLGI